MLYPDYISIGYNSKTSTNFDKRLGETIFYIKNLLHKKISFTKMYDPEHLPYLVEGKSIMNVIFLSFAMNK